MARSILVAILFLTCACGSSTGGTSFNGSIAGNSFSPKDAIFISFTPQANDSSNDFLSGPQLYILISDGANLCDVLKSSQPVKSATVFAGALFTVNGQTSVVPAPGTYPVIDLSASSSPAPTTQANRAISVFTKFDSQCNSIFQGQSPTGTAGKFELTSLSVKAGGHAVGQFDVNFKADHVIGDFSASYCDVSAPSLTGTGSCPK